MPRLEPIADMRMRSVSLILALLCAAPVAMAASSTEARALIERMNKAVVNLNYDGVVEHYWKGGHETLRVIPPHAGRPHVRAGGFLRLEK